VNPRRGFPVRAALWIAAAAAAFGAPSALAQTPPTLPAGCGAELISPVSLFASVTATASSITLTFVDPLPAGTSAGNVNFQICYPTTGDTYLARGWNISMTAGGTSTITTFLNSPDHPNVMAETDYWVRIADLYSAANTLWQHIRTPAASDASVSLTLNSAGADNTYHNGDAIEITATFAENVTVTGTPRIPFTIGSTTRHATYARGSGGTALVFSYTVQSTDMDTDGITVAANALERNNGTINTSASTEAALDHGAVAASTSHKVDGGGATISKVEFTNQPTGSTYQTIGTNVEVTVTFDRPVTVTGTPSKATLAMCGRSSSL